ncbi:Radical SAM domain protein [Thermodesulfatator indicus DSM 15286]|uniref:Radical SAM domain protein n=1 Tax=Thermodesulfatator indicus (strain DSM 15286 / JCM 11887 / CIR29812) TaxID=667014 RepID=F8ABG5_THEID|nr:radical SAM protein [Thermodesulfatator indicus]AEH44478.1 Radical SAM domain protein [Thermodesulfatator indicus DSM 15286]
MRPASVVFGPVKSRRLGLSLGVDPLVPKVCSFDCLYCEIGPTKVHTIERRLYRPTEEIKKALQERLADENLCFEVLTFAGSGEPTLHAELEELIIFAKELTDRPICVLTNSSLLWRKEVRKALLNADLVLPSLDAVNEEIFQKLNKPVKGLCASKIIEGLKKFREEFAGEIWLEIMLVAGVNDHEEEIRALAETVIDISPDKIQLNSVDRPPAYRQAKALPLNKLREIASLFKGEVEVITREALKEKSGKRKPSAEEILALISRRPAPSSEIAEALSCDFKATLSVLEELVKKGRAKTKRHQNQIFYYA